MEDETLMKWTNLEKALDQYNEYVLEAAKNNMPQYYELRDKIKFVLRKEDMFYIIEFNGPEYWKWVENGRKAGKMPPVKPILEWIQKRNIVPYRNEDGKIPSLNSLAFLIARKIGKQGTKGIQFLSKSLDQTKDYFDSLVSDAIEKDIRAELDSIFAPLNVKSDVFG